MMDGNQAGGTLFMCRLCNLFSPSQSLLLAHCSQEHPQQEPVEDIVVALQPLLGESFESPAAVNPVKRKRGRPKGSTKKICTEHTEEKDDFQGEKNPTQDPEDGVGDATPLGLECRSCHRQFSSRRQILKHICLNARELEDEENSISDDEEENCKDLDSDGHKDSFQNSKGAGDFGQRRAGKFRASRKTKKSGLASDIHSSKVNGLGSKKTVINVVLTEEETLPAGVSKMIPVEDISAECVNIQAQSQTEVFQSHSDLLPAESASCGEDPKTDQEQSSTTNAVTTTSPARRGFQEYCIKQDAANSLQGRLKIFTCEFCNKIFKFRHSLTSHLRMHTQEKPFQCPHCDYASAIKANLNVHLRKHTGEKFSCQHCSFTCLSPGHLKVHIERVHMKVKQHCSFCHKKYSDVKNLLKHIMKRHSLKDPAVYQSYQKLKLKTRQGLRELLYHCPTCNRCFKNQLERDRHLLVHGSQRPFVCLLCDHTATKMATLSAHVKKHPFLYVCSVCDGKFVSSHKLKSHLTECHSELDQEQVFIECINSSFDMLQPGGDVFADDNREDTEDGVKEVTMEMGSQYSLDEGVVDNKSQDESTGDTTNPSQVEGDSVSSDWSVEKPSEEPPGNSLEENSQNLTPYQTQEDVQHVPDASTGASSGLTNLSEGNGSTTSGSECQAAPVEKVSTEEPQHFSAFEQVLSSLQKTPLDMERYRQLRKIYGELECQYCGKLFWYKVHYNTHVRTHTKEHLHYCSSCSYSSITKSSLKRHQVQKHSGVLLTCSHHDCKYTTPDKYKLQAHLKTHQEQQGECVTCPVCQHRLPEHRLKQHIRVAHPDKVSGKGLMVKRAEKCPYCDSYFLKNSSEFQQHIWAHQGLKPFACSQCDYTGRSRSNLKTHMNRHNKERCHICDLCGKTFKSNVTLKSHRLSHSNEGKRFQCSACEFTSVSKPSLLRHMEQHTDFKPFRCAHCQYACNIAGPLKRHYKKKHPDQKYENAGPGLTDPEVLKQQGGLKCPECEFVYGTKWELNRHLKNKHGLKVVESTWEVGEMVEAQYVSMEDEEQLTEAHVAALQDNEAVNILQQITEFSTETHNAVTSMVAMAPGTVAVVEQLQVADEKEVCGNQLMVVNAEGELDGNQLMVVDDGHGLEALTVLTQGDNTHHYIVYVQEQTVEIN
ncbi:zinc finger protein ZFAT isoform 1-T1 [Synchiropus picturatus]